MATVIHLKDAQMTDKYEPGLQHTFCLTDKTCGAQNMCMFKAVIPPKTKTRAHFHPDIEINLYVLSGNAIILTGKPGSEDQKLEVGPNMFLHIPKNEVHVFSNESETDPFVMISAYSSPVGADMPKVEVHRSKS
jgi:uncharacterized RmlC-like cupin family protein